MMKKVQVITGGGSGMGLEVAKVLGTQGPVLIGGRTEKKLETALQELKAAGVEAVAMACDVSDKDSVAAFAKKANEMGEIANVIHCAGVSPSMGDAESILRINMVGTVHVVEAFYPLMGQGSVLINIASMAGYFVPMNEHLKKAFADPSDPSLVAGTLPLAADANSAYPISKRFVINYTTRNVVRFAQKGARIVSVSPGTFETPMIASERQSPDVDNIIKATPAGRAGDPKEIAWLIEFLCSEKAAFITGTDVLIDGGFTQLAARDQIQ